MTTPLGEKVGASLRVRRAVFEDADVLARLLADYLRESYDGHIGTTPDQLRRDSLAITPADILIVETAGYGGLRRVECRVRPCTGRQRCADRDLSTAHLPPWAWASARHADEARCRGARRGRCVSSRRRLRSGEHPPTVWADCLIQPNGDRTYPKSVSAISPIVLDHLCSRWWRIFRPRVELRR